MIVFLDANILMQDPMFKGVMWQVVAHAPEPWQLRLVTSEVTAAEAVAGFQRNVAEQIGGLDNVTKQLQRIGASDSAEQFRASLTEKAESYPDHLREALAAAGTDVLAAPDVPHMQLVARAVSRRRPCDENGDGYRDTLSWLTVLGLTADNPEEQVVLVTNDSDFMNAERASLHADLVEDLEAMAATKRVKLAHTLDEVILELAARSPEQGGLKALRAELQEEAVSQYVTTLVGTLSGLSLDPESSALPRRSLECALQSVGPIHELQYEVKGGIGEGKAVADFTFQANCGIVLALPEGRGLDEGVTGSLVAESPDRAVYVVLKPLSFSGIMQLDRYARPTGGQISRIAALADDPGRDQWRRPASNAVGSGQIADVLGQLNVNLVGDALKNFDIITSQAFNLNINPIRDALKNLDVTGQTFKNFNINPVGDALKNLDVTSQLFKNLDINPIRDALKNLDVTSRYFKGFGGFQGTPRSPDKPEREAGDVDDRADDRASDDEGKPDDPAGEGDDRAPS